MRSWFDQSYYRQGDGCSEVRRRMGRLLDDLSLDHFSYLVLRPPRDRRFNALATLHTSYPEEWIGRYMSHRYYNLDPVAELTTKSTRPFFWGHGRFLRAFRRQQRLVFDEAREYRIINGLSIPVRGADGELAVFSVVSHCGKHLADVTRGEHARLFEAAYDTHEIVMADQSDPGGDDEPELSLRERECLLWTLEGKTAGEIATILGLSVSTVNHHAMTATRKMRCLNKHHAAVQALRSGII